MRNMKKVVLMVTLVNLFVACTWACKAFRGWQSLSMEERLFLYDIVVTGTDMKHVFQRNTEGLGQIFDGEFKVSCILKGDNQSINETITIKEVEPWHSCKHTETEVGKMYIAGLKRSDSKYMWDELNLQPAAFPYTDDNMKMAQAVCGLQSPSTPAHATSTGDTTSCHKIEATAPCTGRIQYNEEVIGEERYTGGIGTGGIGYINARKWIIAICVIVVVLLPAE